MTTENHPFEQEGKLAFPDQDSKYWDTFRKPGQGVVCDFLKSNTKKNILDLVRRITESDSRAAFGHYCSNQIKPCTNTDLDELNHHFDILGGKAGSLEELDPLMFEVIVSGAIVLVGASIEQYSKETGTDMKSVFDEMLNDLSS